MAEYIEREALIKAIDNNFAKLDIDVCNPPYYDGANDEYADVRLIIHKQPAADIQPVKHGYWIKQPEKFQIYEDVINSNYLYSCSCCNASDLHSERANNDGKVKFCWRCGARMDGSDMRRNENG